MVKQFVLCGFLPLAWATSAIAQVTVELDINAAVTDPGDQQTDDYVAWAPTFCRARLTGASGSGNETVVLTNDAAVAGGDVLFEQFVAPWPNAKTATQNTLTLSLPKNGDWKPFVVAGKFGRPSIKDQDAVIIAHQDSPTGTEIGREDLMVRIRKNALSLTADERQRYLSAVALLNSMGDYADFQRMHAIANREAHGGPAFLAWHRAMILQYERALQAIDPSVALPYWKFDEAAPALFTVDYLGANGDPVGAGNVEVDFAANNPLAGWQVQGIVLERGANSKSVDPPNVQNDSGTLNPPSNPDQYASFRSMEGNPHSPAHVWVGGWMGSVPTAVRDPLFFMLHCDVDRLWAQWQLDRDRFVRTDLRCYRPANGAPIGHNVGDTMWPWNNVIGPPRPGAAPGDPFKPAAPFALGPPAAPCPGDTIDYAGHAKPENGLGFGYDTVRFGN